MRGLFHYADGPPNKVFFLENFHCGGQSFHLEGSESMVLTFEVYSGQEVMDRECLGSYQCMSLLN